MYKSTIKGKTWKFGENISTDLIMPAAVMSDPSLTPKQAAEFCMSTNRPGWAKNEVNEGDVLIAGKNFGCGSSRPGAKLLKTLGIEVIVAESISRIFFRNCINLGLAALECKGISEFDEGDVLEIDMEKGEVKNITKNKSLKCTPIPPNSPPAQILEAGGIVALLAKNNNKIG